MSSGGSYLVLRISAYLRDKQVHAERSILVNKIALELNQGFSQLIGLISTATDHSQSASICHCCGKPWGRNREHPS